jgi:hypothetical protein
MNQPTHHFTENDLIANREGRLSESQKVILQERLSQQIVIVLVVCIFLPLAVCLLLFAVRDQSGFMPMLEGTLSVLIPIIIAAAIVFLFRIWALYADLRDAHIRRVVGPGTFTVTHSAKPPSPGRPPIVAYHLQVGQEHFRLSRATLHTLKLNAKLGSIYTVYIAPRSKTLLGIEETP